MGVVARFGSDIKKFGRVLKVIKLFEVVFALIPVHVMLRMFFFSKVCLVIRQICVLGRSPLI